MARVWLHLGDCAGGHLPGRCVVCGSDEDVEYLVREMEYRPKWPISFLGLHFVGLPLVGAFLGWFTERYNREVFTKLPYCGAHGSYWERRDFRQHLGILIVALGWLLPLLVTFALNNNARLGDTALAVALSATAVGLAVIYSLGFRAVHVADLRKARLLLADVHPDFVAAVKQGDGYRS